MKYRIAFYACLLIFFGASLSSLLDGWLHPSQTVRWIRWGIALVFWIGTMISNYLLIRYDSRQRQEEFDELVRRFKDHE